ncbi:MAG: HD-GYP domain-containing protein [Desulfuromonas sp.]|nr:HD-GYP domain-containing protein [Desulfuromonas sp.]
MMLRPAKSSIKTTIQRQLLIRLIIACTLISICLAATVFFIEFHRLGQQIGNRANEIATRFNDEIRALLDDKHLAKKTALHEKLKTLAIAGKFNLGMGHLIYSAIYDLSGNAVVTEQDNQCAYAQDVAELMNALDHKLAPHTQAYHKYLDINKIAHIHLVYPLTNSAGKRAASVEGLFAISQQAEKQVEKRILLSALGTVGIVVLTTIILYPVIIILMRRLSKLTDNLLQANIETIKVLGNAVAKRDSDTDIHNYRVTIYSVALAEAMGLSTHQIQALIKGAFLHDIGKIGIFDHILLKSGPLTEDERETMKHHVYHGMDIIKHSDWLKDATDVVQYHHEQFSGDGYPCGLAGEDIPLNARIFAVADVFDALTSSRPYKVPMPCVTAMETMEQGCGSHFDPAILETFTLIAPDLYEQVARLTEDDLQKKLLSLTSQYFTSAIYDNV